MKFVFETSFLEIDVLNFCVFTSILSVNKYEERKYGF